MDFINSRLYNLFVYTIVNKKTTQKQAHLDKMLKVC